MHKDDDGDDCSCDEQEIGYLRDENGKKKENEGGYITICPECGAPEEKLSLVCGDHGYRCSKCNATFTCP